MMQTRQSGYELDKRTELLLLLDSQDRAAVAASIPASCFEAAGLMSDEITVYLLTPDFAEVWGSETKYPGSLAACYTRIC